MKKNFLYLPPVFVFTSLFLIVIFYFVIPEFNFIPYPYNLVGIIISIAGFYLMSKAHYLFLKHKTTRMLRESEAIITEGVFSFTRNPMYLGMFLLILGISVCFRNVFSIVAPFLFMLYINLIIIPHEETLMKKVFGDEYISYKKRVRRWI